MDTFSVQSAAESALRDANRLSYGGEVFSKEQLEYISKAIAKAIEVYDEQKK